MLSGIDVWRFTNIRTVVFVGFFSFIKFAFVTQKWKSKGSPIELVTQSENIFQFRVGNSKIKKEKFNFRVSNSKVKNKSSILELVTQGEIFYFSSLS